MDKENITKLEDKIGIKFNDKNLLLEALTHRSYLNERSNEGLRHNERMEFLGDAVLELVVTEYLYNNFKDPEGLLTAWRAALVNTVELANVSQKFDLNSHILLSKGEAKDVGRARQTILANAFEALIGVIHIDKGYEAARSFIDRFLIPELEDILAKKLYKDPKSLLQEKAQELVDITPSYKVSEEWGPDHAKIFRIAVLFGDKMVGEGVGPSKQDAQRSAAEDALHKMEWD